MTPPPPLTFNAWLRHDLIFEALEGLEIDSVLEIGAGGGAMGARLAERFDYVGLEPDPASFETARGRIEEPGLGRVVNGDATALPEGATFDLVCAFEVLEHIEDDADALRSWRTRIAPGGWLLLSVPAFQRRFGPWDDRVGHFRRYDPLDMRTLLLSTGFDVPVISTYGFPLGNALERSRNLVARSDRRRSDAMDERTAASGRSLQMPNALGQVSRAATAPFRWIQRGFTSGKHGTGLVVLAGRDA
ncbi:MAG TPA: class I SAM-dependent methyltransferase [Actinomycetota bacterium]|nr:class I SAM-dependent methyltransferase [Actinomycetota bacterium]